MKTVNTISEGYLELMKSKFYAFLIPINSENEAKQIVKDYKKKHKKAKHVVYAYVVDGKYKSNDDGEPSGTAGRPLLELLMKKELNKTLLIVVRYFGGTLLGASRLLRTYVNSGALVLNKAEFVDIN